MSDPLHYPPGLTAGDVLRLERLRQGRGLREVARWLRLSPTHLSHCERNRPGCRFAPDTLARLALHLMLDPWEMLVRDGHTPEAFADAMRRDPRGAAMAMRAVVARLETEAGHG